MTPLKTNSGKTPESAASRKLASESLNSTQPPGSENSHTSPVSLPEDVEPFMSEEWERLHEDDEDWDWERDLDNPWESPRW